MSFKKFSAASDAAKTPAKPGTKADTAIGEATVQTDKKPSKHDPAVKS